MHIPISDLMAACFPEQAALCGPDTELAERIRKNVNERKEKKKRRLPLAVLIAAVAAVLAIGTVAAVVFSRITVRDVAGEEVGHYVPDMYGSTVYVEWEKASLAFDFEIEAEGFKEVYVRPNWLPVPRSEEEAFVGDTDADGWTVFQTSDPWAYGTPFQLQVYWGYRLVDRTFIISGDTEIVKEDTWNGLKRFEVAVHEPDDPFDGTEMADTNYIILFSETDNYLIRICGTSDFETLERIAEEMEIRVTDTVIQEGSPAAEGLFGVEPLDMEGDRLTKRLQQEIEEAIQRGDEDFWMTENIPEILPETNE